MISGIHHICIKAYGPEQYQKTLCFYRDLLGFEIVRHNASSAMLNAGNTLIELFDNADREYEKGVIQHIALACDDVDGLFAKIKEAGYPIIKEPRDIVLAMDRELKARIAFLQGACGEEIELFQEK